MKIWQVEDGFILDEEAPNWATKAAWRKLEAWGYPDMLLRVWLNDDDTMYQYLKGYSGFCEAGVVYQKSFLHDSWQSEATVYAVLTECQPMVCHDRFGFMTDEFKNYSHSAWLAMNKSAEKIIHQAIKDGVDPMAMKELLKSAIDCGTTVAQAEAKVASHSNNLD